MEARNRHGVELIPGTEILSQDKEIGLVRGEKRGYEGLVLVPQPSNDPNDPLVNFPSQKRFLHNPLKLCVRIGLLDGNTPPL